MRAFGPPLLHGVQPMPYPALQSMFDALYPPGLQWYWRADFVNELTDEAIAEHVRVRRRAADAAVDDAPLPDRRRRARVKHGRHAVYLSRRALGRGHRRRRAPTAQDAAKITAWTKSYWDALHPYSAGGAYVNIMMDEGDERVRASLPRQLRAAGAASSASTTRTTCSA